MSLLANIQKMLEQGASGVSSTLDKGLSALGQNKDGLSALLKPAALGGIAGLLLVSKAARGFAGGALLAGVGTVLWNKYKDRIRETNVATAPEYGQARSTPEERAVRLVRALVFAAKSDGHIDDKEQQAIQSNLQVLNLGEDTERLISGALQEPLNPELVAQGVKNEEEALEVYTLSCAVIDLDHFMERSYLDALAKALRIPDDVKKDLEAKIVSGRDAANAEVSV